MNEILDIAIQWVNNGVSVIPIRYRDKRPATNSLLATGRPTWEQYKESLPEIDELKVWFGGLSRNLGIITGSKGLVVVDFDTTDSYEAWLSWAEIIGGNTEKIAHQCYRVKTSRGMHVYLHVEEPTKNYKVPGIDIKGQWGYVLAPPSIHPTGSAYRAKGRTIAHVGQLSDVFPFSPNAYQLENTPLAAPFIYSDVFDAADHARLISPNSIEMIKESIRIEDVLPTVKEAQTRREYILMHCPLHTDKHPSFWVNLTTQMCGCFAGCNGGKAMDVIGLFAHLQQITNRDAIAILGNRVK